MTPRFVLFFCSQGFGFTADGLARSGCYYADCAATKCSLPARDPRLARALWETSERLCGMETGTALPRVDGGSFGGGETFDGIAMQEGGRRGGGRRRRCNFAATPWCFHVRVIRKLLRDERRGDGHTRGAKSAGNRGRRAKRERD